MDVDLTDIKAVRSLLERHGFSFSKSLGQNFLIASWVPEKIASAAELSQEYGVLEIGPGIGCLTAQLARNAGKVVAVELDRSLGPVLKETLSGYGNIEIIFGDILRQKIPQLIEEKLPDLKPCVCANLPYNVTTPILTALTEAECFESVTVMIQREVAQRICAAPGTESYGAFGIYIQWHFIPEMMFDVPPSCFIPQPKVTSSVIRLVRRNEPPYTVNDEKLMFRLVRAAFNQRRKTFVNSVSSAMPEYSKELLADVLASHSLRTDIRGEKLSIEDFCAISDELSDKP